MGHDTAGRGIHPDIQHAVNRRITLAVRPRGRPVPADFELVMQALPTPAEGQVLLRTLYLSLDPYMRNLMEEVGPGYAPPMALGDTMVGGTVSRVMASRNPRWQVGDVVLANAGWQEWALSDGQDLLALGDPQQPSLSSSLALGGLGMPGFTAYVGLLDIGRPRPGETVVVAAATGGVGSVVGQIARLKGARAVGIAGGSDKCRHAVETLGFHACIDRHDPNFAEQLAAACPDGVDVYFENVSGAVFDAVLPLLNLGARVPVCGFISHYNDHGNEYGKAQTSSQGQGPDRLPGLMVTLLSRRVQMQGLIILDHYETRHKAFREDMLAWVASGEVKLREHRVDGLEQAPRAFIGLLDGANFGKVVVRVAQDAP